MSVIHIFEEENPHPEIELDYKNPFTLLIAILLSAQATDKHVNKVTQKLFESITTPYDVIHIGFDQLQESLKSINHYRNKSKYIYQLSEKLIQDFKGDVPNDRESLKTLPGIGQKSANVFLNAVHHAHYIPVDTHVFRVTQRLGICLGKTPEQIEEQLESITPEEYKSRISGWLVLHGRYICKAKKPQCEKCPLNQYCDYYQKNF